MSRRRAITVAAEIFAALLKGPKPWSEVVLQAGVSNSCSTAWLEVLRSSGVVRISGYTTPSKRGRPARIVSLQDAPFALPDVPRPEKKAVR